MANTPLAAVPDELFTPANAVMASIGLAGTGIIRPLYEDAREFPCTATLTVGTGGGQFVDAESGEPRGTGQRRWLQQGPVELCGSIVTFVYSGIQGQYVTAVEIERR